jgi:hypothetical protein
MTILQQLQALTLAASILPPPLYYSAASMLHAAHVPDVVRITFTKRGQ